MNRIPTGPIVASVLVLVAGGLYFALRSGTSDVELAGFFRAPPPDVVRVVTWNVGLARPDGDESSSVPVEHVAGVLNRLEPGVVLLQGLGSRQELEAIVAALSGEWAWEAVPRRRGADRYLAVLARSVEGVIEPVDRRLINTSSGERALAYDVRSSLGRDYRFICLDAAGGDEKGRRRYFDDLLRWVDERGPAITVLAGDFGFDVVAAAAGESRSSGGEREMSILQRLGARFTDCGPVGVPTAGTSGRVDYLFVAPKTVSARSAVVSGAALPGIPHSPVVADLTP